MKNTFKRSALLMASSSLLAALSATAANSFYAAGDLMLTFQKVGSTKTVYADLGNAATLYRGAAAGPDGASNINFMDLNSTLTSAFGAGWASDPNIYAGLAGVFSNNFSATPSAPVTLGDPGRTLYVSAPRTNVGTVGAAASATPSVGSNTDMTNAANDILAQNNVLGTYTDVAQTVSLTDVSQIDDRQPITIVSGNNLQGTAFRAFGGGIQQAGSETSFGTFGDAGETEFALDLYRILARNDLGSQVGGDLRTGTFEGTITVGTNGMVSFQAVPEPSALVLSGLAAGALILRRRRSA